MVDTIWRCALGYKTETHNLCEKAEVHNSRNCRMNVKYWSLVNGQWYDREHGLLGGGVFWRRWSAVATLNWSTSPRNVLGRKDGLHSWEEWCLGTCLRQFGYLDKETKHGKATTDTAVNICHTMVRCGTINYRFTVGPVYNGHWIRQPPA